MPLYQNIIASPGFSANGIVVTGEQPRITGDFSNATVANRVMFQTSTTNDNTLITAIPNGTSNFSGFYALNGTGANVSRASLAISGTDVRLVSGIEGTGTYLPMTFYTGGSERMRIDTSGNVGIGTSSPNRALVVNSAIKSQGWGGANNGNIFFGADERVSIFGGADTLVAYTSTLERMRIDSSGNVGIGTIPYSVAGYTFLTVKNSTNGGIIQVKDPSVDMRMQTSNSSAGFFGTYSNHPLLFIANSAEKMRIDTAGHLYPAASGTQDLGASTLRWRNIYTSDLNLSNGIGDYTIVEGEDDLFLYNNKSGKVFKFALIEVDPSTAPAKKG